MGETRRMGRRLLALLGLVLALVVVAPAAADDPSDDKAAVDARIAALQADIAQSKAQEGVLTSQLSAVAAEVESAESAVEDAEAAVGGTRSGALVCAQPARRARSAARRRRPGSSSAFGTSTTGRLPILDARVRAAYIDEPPDMLAFLVSASSFDEVIDNVELLNRIGRQDKRIARSGPAGARSDGGRAARDDRDEARAGGDGVGHLRPYGRGARGARQPRRRARSPRRRRVVEAERAHGHAGRRVRATSTRSRACSRRAPRSRSRSGARSAVPVRPATASRRRPG